MGFRVLEIWGLGLRRFRVYLEVHKNPFGFWDLGFRFFFFFLGGGWCLEVHG